jgi:hypothetical protein
MEAFMMGGKMGGFVVYDCNPHFLGSGDKGVVI